MNLASYLIAGIAFYTPLNMFIVPNMHFQEQIMDKEKELIMSEVTILFITYFIF